MVGSLLEDGLARNMNESLGVSEKIMKKILVADDDRETRHLLSGILETAGFEVATVEDGDSALTRLLSEEFDCF